MIEGILIGLKTALSFQNLMMVMIGCFAGTIIECFQLRPNDCNCFNDTNHLWF